MKKIIYTLLILLLAFATNGQVQPAFNVGFTDSITSKILNENRQLLVYTPYSNQNAKPNSQGIYPILFVLDGESHFRSTVATVERLVSNGVCPSMIIIGIPNTNRTKDLTPIAVSGNTDGLQNTGGGEKFVLFIEKELIPYIQANYPSAPYRIILGHSLAGLMVIHTLTNNENLFNSYIAIDAAIWWDNHKALNDAKVSLTKKNYENKTLFLAMANRMEKGIDTIAVQSDTSDNTELIRYNLDLKHFISKNPKNKLRFKSAYYEDERHNTVTFPATYDALRFIFNFYELPPYANYTTNNPQLLALIKQHYNNVSKELGYEVLPPQAQINSLGYRALSQKQFPVAKQLFEMNVENYPDDPNLMDSLGDYFNTVNDKSQAIIWYRKALAKIEIKETRNKLNKLISKSKNR